MNGHSRLPPINKAFLDMMMDSALSAMLEIKKVSVSHLNFLKQANASLLLKLAMYNSQ